MGEGLTGAEQRDTSLVRVLRKEERKE